MPRPTPTARHARSRRSAGPAHNPSRRRSLGWVVVGLLAVSLVVSAGGALQQASARPLQPRPWDNNSTAPSTPTNLRVVSATTTSLTLAWSAATDEDGVAGYEVRRRDTRRVERV